MTTKSSPDPNQGQSLRSKTIWGVVWTGLGQYGSNGLRFLALLGLAALLPPSDFGLLGLSMIFLFFAQGVGELGLSAAIVHEAELDDELLNTAFWSNMAVNVVLALITLAVADSVTAFLGDAAAAPLLRSLSPVFPIMAMSVVPRAVLTRDLQFGPLSVQQLLSEVAFTFVGLAMAWSGFGVWSLSWAVLSHRVVGSLFLWQTVRWRPKAIFRAARLRRLLGFGAPFMAGAIANRGIGNIDYFFVGRWLGTEALGYYSLAFQFGAVPLERLVGVLTRVAFPAFTNLRADRSRMKQAFLTGSRHLFAALAPLSLLIAATAPWLTRAAYGDKWAPSVTALQILAVGGFFYAFDMVQALFFAVGRPQFRLWVTLLRLAAFVVGVLWFASGLTIEWVAWSLSGALLISGGLSWWWAVRFLEISASEGWRTIRPAAGAGLLASLALLPLAFPWAEEASPWVVSAYLLASVSTLYGAGIWIAYRPSLRVWIGAGVRRSADFRGKSLLGGWNDRLRRRRPVEDRTARESDER